MRAHRPAGPAAVLIVMLLAAGCAASEPRARSGRRRMPCRGRSSTAGSSRFVTAGDYIPTLYQVRSPGDISLHDRETGETFSIVNMTDLREEYSSFTNPTLSGDGRYLAFEAIAPLPKDPYIMEAGNQSH